jgi:2-octaprenyl-6-methoxyphenol hydroxylase
MAERQDAVIVGGGLVGQALALALASAELEVAVIERAEPEAQMDAGFDTRASAIASASARMLRTLGLAPLLDGEGCAIRTIRVSEGLGRGHLVFDSADADPPEPLGIMVENRALRGALLAEVQRRPEIRLVAPATVAGVARDAAGAVVHLADGTVLAAPVVIAADGRRSALRARAGIRVSEWRYGGAAIVTMIAHARLHGDVACEIFFPAGPLAQLPMRPLADGRHRSAIVWTVRAADAPGLAALGPRGLAREIEVRLGGGLGAVSLLAPPVVHRFAYHHAERYWAERLILVGDAAHGIHPIAGQGLNMGLRDVAALAQTLADAVRTGRDPGHPDVARAYERWRRADNSATAAATDGLARLFGVPGAAASAIRRAGLAAVERMPPLKRRFMGVARGEAGDLPLLLRGEAL